MGDSAFDIYQTDVGYAAVTSLVQRQILDALRAGEKQLPELVQITGRSKPTLSSLHMKELLARDLISEFGHPTDSRRKVYRLRGAKIGSSDLPVAQLKEAVQHYVSLSPLSTRVPLSAALDAIAAAPASTATKVLHAQGHRLGMLAAALVRVTTARELWLRVSSLLEAEQIATPQIIDLERGALELRLGTAVQGSPQMMAPVLAGFFQGIAKQSDFSFPIVVGAPIADGVRLCAK